MDGRGIHHITFQAPLEAVGDEMSHGTIDVMVGPYQFDDLSTH